MAAMPGKTRTIGVALAALIVLQGFCAIFFLSDLARDFMEMPDPEVTLLHFTLEVVANLALLAGAAVEAAFLAGLLRRQAHAERALSAASESQAASASLWTGIASPVRAASLTVRLRDLTSRASAGTSVPGTRTMMSPGTRSAGSPRPISPSRTTATGW